MKRPSPVTAMDVARLAGVSQSAVSRALTPGASISAALKSQVMKAARQLDYRPNVFARVLITRQSGIIGVVMGDVTNPFYADVLGRLSARLQMMGRKVLFASTPSDTGPDVAVEQLFEYRPSGIIMTATNLSRRMAERCADEGIQVVMLNRVVPGPHASSVRCDSVAGGRTVARFLLAGGHRRFGFVAGPRGAASSRERELGYARELEKEGRALPLQAEADFSYHGGFDAAKRLLATRAPPDAIFCASDEMALGALDAARYELGLRVPDDVSIIGFDDIPAASWTGYELTTIRQPINRILDETLSALIEKIENPAAKAVVRRLPGELIVRRSARTPTFAEVLSS